jgi:hypothetical protein
MALKPEMALEVEAALEPKSTIGLEIGLVVYFKNEDYSRFIFPSSNRILK